MSLVVGLMHVHLISLLLVILRMKIFERLFEVVFSYGEKVKWQQTKKKEGKILKVLKVKILKVKSCCLVVSGDADS